MAHIRFVKSNKTLLHGDLLYHYVTQFDSHSDLYFQCCPYYLNLDYYSWNSESYSLYFLPLHHIPPHIHPDLLIIWVYILPFNLSIVTILIISVKFFVNSFCSDHPIGLRHHHEQNNFYYPARSCSFADQNLH